MFSNFNSQLKKIAYSILLLFFAVFHAVQYARKCFFIKFVSFFLLLPVCCIFMFSIEIHVRIKREKELYIC